MTIVEAYLKEIASLEAEVEWLEMLLREERAASCRCPWPTCRKRAYASRNSLYRHMQNQHGMPLLAAVRESS